jgi:hypothetical protein
MKPVFPEFVGFKAPLGFLAAVAEAAKAERTTMSEWLRRSGLRSLQQAGVPIDEAGAPRERVA